MREVVNVHIGQGGNQIGTAFWNLLLLEHEKTPDTDPALSSFFYFSPSKSSGKSRYEMKARALLVDMECGPLQEVMKGSLGGLFDEAQYIMDVSGAGNNFAQGFSYYGNQYHDRFLEGIRKNTEKCESLQAFFLTHSLGGGTGSGVGTYILSLLYDEYRKVTRFSTCIYPTDENDVITSPYNTLLATRELIEHADCVFPLNNSALFKFFQLENPTKANSGVENPEVTQGVAKSKKRSRGFDEVNLIAARMLCHVTSSCRFHGEMNVDLNEIYTNLVPFPRLHFLMTALNIRQPALPSNQRQDYSRTALQRAFGEITSNKGQLSGSFQYSASNPPIPQSSSSTISVTTNYNPHGKPMTIASAFLARGKVTLSEFIQCVTHSQRQVLQFPEWNPDACKIGMCNTSAPGEEMSVMGVYNSTAFASTISRDLANFQRLFRAKAMLHHYTEYLEEDTVKEAGEMVQDLVLDYKVLENSTFPRPDSLIARQNPFYNQCPPLFPVF